MLTGRTVRVGGVKYPIRHRDGKDYIILTHEQDGSLKTQHVLVDDLEDFKIGQNARLPLPPAIDAALQEYIYDCDFPFLSEDEKVQRIRSFLAVLMKEQRAHIHDE